MSLRLVDWLEPRFSDRAQAGEELAEAVALAVEVDLVLALAKGGVQVAVPAARALGVPLSAVSVARVNKHGLRLGATTAEGPPYLLEGHGVDEDAVKAAVAAAERKAGLLESHFHHERLPLLGQRVLVIDDGLVTGLTLAAGLVYAGAQGAREVYGAVPVGHPRGLGRAAQVSKGVLCLHSLAELAVVGQAYDIFDPLEEWFVASLLADYAAERSSVSQ